MTQHLEDAMTIVSKHGSPSFFVTFTPNKNWPEVQELIDNQVHTNRPDAICRVFHEKLKKMIKLFTDGQFFGILAAHIYVVEFQKRGLPHAHILLTLDQNHRLQTAADLDLVISAEIPDRETHPRLYQLVTSQMLHGPCGRHGPTMPCMENGRCSRKFPKRYAPESIFNPNGLPTYRRRQNNNRLHVLQSGFHVSNKWVVPYCPALTLMFGCHINVEACTSLNSVKYLFKYIYKGPDSANFVIDHQNGQYNYDEIGNYLSMNYFSFSQYKYNKNYYVNKISIF